MCNNVSFIDQGKAPYKHIPYHVLKKTVKCKVYLAGVPPLDEVWDIAQGSGCFIYEFLLLEFGSESRDPGCGWRFVTWGNRFLSSH